MLSVFKIRRNCLHICNELHLLSFSAKESNKENSRLRLPLLLLVLLVGSVQPEPDDAGFFGVNDGLCFCIGC